MDVSHTENYEKAPNIDPHVTPEQWLGPLKLGSHRVRFETCWCKSDDSTPADVREIQWSLLKTNCEPRVLRKQEPVTGMISELITSKHPLFKYSNILETGALMKRKKGDGVGTHFRKEPDNHRMLAIYDLGVQSTLFLFAVKNGSRTRCQIPSKPALPT